MVLCHKEILDQWSTKTGNRKDDTRKGFDKKIEMNQIIVNGISIDDFLTKVEQASYNGQKRAIEEEKILSSSIDWSKYSKLMSVDDLVELFPIKKPTARVWIKNKRFGDYSETRKMLLVEKIAVRRYYESTLVKGKR